MRREYCEGAKQPATEPAYVASSTKTKTGTCAKCGGVFQLTMAGRPFPHKVPIEKLPSETAKPSEDLGL